MTGWQAGQGGGGASDGSFYGRGGSGPGGSYGYDHARQVKKEASCNTKAKREKVAKNGLMILIRVPVRRGDEVEPEGEMCNSFSERPLS